MTDDDIRKYEAAVKQLPGWPEIIIKPWDECFALASSITNPWPSSPSETHTVSGEGERAVAGKVVMP